MAVQGNEVRACSFLNASKRAGASRFDIPFGLDYRFFAAPDRTTINAPLITRTLFGGGLDREGIRVYSSGRHVQYTLFWTRDLADGLPSHSLRLCCTCLALHSLDRVAGPLWRFEQVAKSICEGNLDVRAELRQADELKDFSAGLGRMSESLADRIGRLRSVHRNMLPLVKELELQTGAATALDELQKHLAEARLILQQFKIPSEGLPRRQETAEQERTQP